MHTKITLENNGLLKNNNTKDGKKREELKTKNRKKANKILNSNTSVIILHRN